MADTSPASLLAGGVGNLLRRRTRRSRQAVGLAFVHHEIAPQQGDPSNDLIPALGEKLFAAQLEHLGRHYDVVALAELPARINGRSRGEKIPAAITLDDDLANHLAVAAPILERFGFPATFFLCGNTLDGPSPYWWQDLQTICDRPGGWPRLAAELGEQWPWAGLGGQVQQFAMAMETARPVLRDAVAARLREIAAAESVDPGLPPESVRELAGRGFEIGFHTRRHYSMQALSDEELDAAMSEGVEDLEKAAGYRPTAIAYPYGNADLRVAEAAQRAGFTVGVLGGHSATAADHHPLLLGRAVAWTPSLGVFKYGLGRLVRAS
jgi:peptidoglycan/xylan/chitin deacetylase (PgdA/CDA1 family)